MSGDKLRSLRKAKGLTQDRLAEMSGLSKGFLSLVEAGERNLSVSAMIALSDALGVPSCTLLSDEPMSEETMRLLNAFASLSNENRLAILNHAEALARMAEIGRMLK